MPTVTLLAREVRQSPFWAKVISFLVNNHNYIVKDIDRTVSTPADLTFPQYNNLSMLFVSNEVNELDGQIIETIKALSSRGRRIMVAVQSANRNWERIQLQITLLGFTISLFPGLSPANAAFCITSFVASLNTVAEQEPITNQSAESLRYLDLDDEHLELLYSKTRNLAQLSEIFNAVEYERDWWVQELGETIVQAIDAFFSKGASFENWDQ